SRHTDLNRARLPIPPPGLSGCHLRGARLPVNAVSRIFQFDVKGRGANSAGDGFQASPIRPKTAICPPLLRESGRIDFASLHEKGRLGLNFEAPSRFTARGGISAERVI